MKSIKKGRSVLGLLVVLTEAARNIRYKKITSGSVANSARTFSLTSEVD